MSARGGGKWRPNRMTLMITVFVFCTLVVSIALMVGLSILQTRFFSQQFHRFNPFLLFALISVILGTSLSVLFSRWLVKPIRAVVRAADALAEGEFDTRLDIRTPYEFQALSASFNQMARQLESTKILRKDFIANVSHEFKTPISIIKGYADLIEAGASEQECREYGKVIQVECQRLLSLSSNILSISRLENGMKLEEPHMFSLDEQIRQVVLALRPRWEEAGLHIELELLDISLMGSEELLAQVWYNLLDNAIKFSPQGESVTIAAYRVEGAVVVSCADRGAGMDDATRERAFEQFYQGDASRTIQGNGLGLTLAAKIVELHRGTIAIRSARGKGTTIKVTLPA